MTDSDALIVSMTRLGAREAALRLQAFLSEGGERYRLCNAYEGLARALGYRNWNTLCAAFDALDSGDCRRSGPDSALPSAPRTTDPSAMIPRSSGPLAMKGFPHFEIAGERYVTNWAEAAVSELLPAEHGVCIGPCGSGKSVLLALLGLVARRDTGARCVFLDRHQGLRIPVLAQGGNWHKAPWMALAEGDGPICVDLTDLYGQHRDLLRSTLDIVGRFLKRASGERFLLVDETEPMLAASEFRSFYEGMLSDGTPRTRTISSFQRPGALRTAEGAMTAFQLSDTFYLLPNPGAEASDYDLFGLSEQELAFVLGRSGIPRSRHSALVRRRGGESFLLDFDLAILKRAARVFSSGVVDLAALDHVLGLGLEKWVDAYVLWERS